MELDWTYDEERQRGTLRHSFGMEARREKKADPKQPGGEWLKMEGKQLDGRHGRMSEPSRQTVVVGKRLSKPYVPYGIKRYRIGFTSEQLKKNKMSSRFK